MMRNDATEAQVRAANPASSTWLAANAGSGKTRVLTDRVARLLLNDVLPEKILCLTYTKAAASEMQNRLFQRLGEWAMLPEAELRHALEDLGYDGTITPEKITEARSLFARAIETPGGLKIQTIHAFCSAVLRRFPREAGVSPQFQEMEERAAELLRARILQEMAAEPDAPVLAALAQNLTDPDFDAITKGIIGARDRFTPGSHPEDLFALVGLPDSFDKETLRNITFLGGEADLIRDLIPILDASGGNDAKAAVKLRTVGPLDLSALPTLEAVFLTGAGAKAPFTAKIGSFPKKAIQSGPAAPLMPALEAFMQRLESARDMRLKLQLLARTSALHEFANAFLPRYAAAKAARGWLDFDDLIVKTRDLLADPLVASWVLFRLDGGIDHILVDEAQDTSPVQWDVIERLAEEFTSGRGARSETGRTIFVVGDKKQSIYSFQGADPDGFDRMRARFKDKLEAIQAPFQDAVLQYSFRSSGAILGLVDQTFQGRTAAGFTNEAPHRAFHNTMPGRVDLWPVVEPTEPPEDRHWTDTVDQTHDTHETVRLAETIAREIGKMLGGAAVLPKRDGETWVGRKIEPRDILILVQRRSALFEEIIRACKAAKLPIAGADRLKVGAELAVRDLAALVSWLALPEDDLALATALRSPLFGWSEQELFTLAHDRKEPYLWRTLQARAEAHPETWDTLKDLRDHSDFLRPYDLIERALIRHGGRGKLLARLGPEAEDGINALLEQAIAYEGSEIPSLTGFLLWMQTGDLEIKRQPDAASNQIRVMTVHGAKGLEAPIVILPDCGKRQPRVTDAILPEPQTPLWKPNNDQMPALMQPWVDAEKDRVTQERDRLLYVAMTRAESWLIVAAAGDLGKDGEAWHDRVRSAMQDSGAVPMQLATPGHGLRIETGDWPEEAAGDPEPIPQNQPTVPDWVKTPVLEPKISPQILTPTGLGGAKALAGDAGQDEDAALAHGTAVHHWLERLSQGPQPTSDDPAYLEARRVLDAPDLKHLFGSNSLAEVPITAHVPIFGARMHGVIDRLIVTDTEVLAVDFKTNATVPATPDQTPDGLLRQIGAYAHMLAEVYPNREVKTALLWTNTATLMHLPHDLVTRALAATTSS